MTQALAEKQTRPVKPGGKAKKAKGTTRTAFSVYDAMGSLLGVSVDSDADVLKLQRQGIPYQTFARLAEHLSKEGTQIIISRATLHRRKENAEPLSTEESERAVRIARILARAIDVFGDEAEAKRWLNAPGPYIEGEEPVSPVQLCAYEAGARIIEDRLGRAAHGMF